MLWWHNQIEQAKVNERLERLGSFSVKYFTIGCVTHVKDKISDIFKNLSDSGIESAAQILDELWRYYPSSLQRPHLETIEAKIAKILPEEGSKPEWEESFIWAVTYAMTVATQNGPTAETAQLVHEAMHQSYWSLFSFACGRDRAFDLDDSVQAEEKSSEVCRTEVEFQLAFLSILEGMHDQPPGYYAILQMLED